MVVYWGGVGAQFLHWVREISYVNCNYIARFGVGDRCVSFPQPLVFHTDSVQLVFNGRHHHTYFCGNRSRLRAGQRVYRLLSD